MCAKPRRVGSESPVTEVWRRDSRVQGEVKSESIGGFEVGMELTVKAFQRGLRICELPTTWVDRTAGASRFRIARWVPHYARWYWLGPRSPRSGR